MTRIEWTDRVWNPTVGCTRVSPGCANCYAERVARRGLSASHRRLTNERGRWTGEVRLVEERLQEPLKWRKPCRVFVDSMSDLFHEAVPFEYVDRVFAVMGLKQRHTFQVLTKRPHRMREWALSRARSSEFIERAVPEGYSLRWQGIPLLPWPLPNVWLGVSVEDQARADERIAPLLATPAAVRFASVEPMLGPIEWFSTKDADGLLGEGGGWVDPLGGTSHDGHGDGCGVPRLDWVILGGESGPGARACNLAWIGSALFDCVSRGVPVFVKQLGAVPIDPNGPRRLRLRDGKGGDWDEWPEPWRSRLRRREFPG